MSHFVGDPSRLRLWTTADSIDPNAIIKAKNMRERLLSGPTVDIYVGPDCRHWSLHKNLLCHHSSYFETEFRGYEVPKRDDQPQHNKLELPDDDPMGFELLVKWLYQGHLNGDEAEMTDENRYEYAVACHRLYQLCDKFDILLLKNLAMDAYRMNLHLAELVPDAQEMNEIYRSSTAASPMRKLMTKIAARQIMDPETDKDAETYRVCFNGNSDFAIEVLNAIRSMSGGGMLFADPTADNDCNEWHDHRDGSVCYLKKRKLPNSTKGTQSQNAPNSAVVRTQRLPAELGTERPTPRQSNASPRAKRTPMKAQARPTGLTNGVMSTPRRSITDNAALRTRDRLKNLNVNCETNHIEPKSTASIKIPSRVASAQEKLPGSERASSRPTSVDGSSAGRASSAEGGRPRKLNHVNGLVRQFDAADSSVNGTGVGSWSQSSEKRRPPKLKRKALG